MMTLAQAQALFLLAEALEACEQQSITVEVPGRSDVVLNGVGILECVDLRANDSALTGGSIRLAINALIPKQENQDD